MKPKSKNTAATALLSAIAAPVAMVFTASNLQAATIVPVAWKASNSFSALRTPNFLSNSTGMNGAETILYNHDASISGEPNTANNSQWLTSSKTNTGTLAGMDAAMTAGKIWIIADLGASYDLTTIKIWNFNWDNTAGSPLTHLNDRGVSQFDVFVRNTVADTDDGTVGGSAINLTSVSDLANALTNAAVFDLGTSNQWTQALSDQALTQSANDDTSNLGQSFDLTGNTARYIAIRVDNHHNALGGIGLGKVRIEGIPEPSAALLGGIGLLALLRRRR